MSIRSRIIFNSYEMSQNDASPKVSSSENRRSSKPIMEKRRRARINSSLAELKALLIDVLKNEGTHHSKMEKADILEMTVKHLRQIQRQQFAVAAAVDPTIINKYQVGFNECATEVARYLSSIEGLDIELRSRLLNHLANCLQMQNIQRSESTAVFGPNAVFPAGTVNHTTPIQWRRVPSPPKLATVFKTANNDVYAQKIMTSGINANAMLTGGIQLLPTRLPTGETAFIIPGGIKAEDVRLNNYVIPVYSQSANRNVSPTSAPQNSITDTRCLVTNNNEKRLLADPRSSSMQHLTDTKQCVIENITPPPPEIDSKIAPPEQVKIEHVWRPW